MYKKFLLIILFFNLNLISLPTLSLLESYAQQYEEFPKADNENWLDADYSNYHRSIRSTWFGRFLDRLGISRQNRWNPYRFKSLITSLTKEREKQFGSGRLFATLKCSPESKVYVWGDLQGAFHSLIRDLAYLKKQEIIDNNLKIIKPNHYFVFNGDAIDRSPYTLETLHLLLILLKINPEQVIYVRGKHEDKGHWVNYALKRELKIRAFYASDQQIPLKNEIGAFFNTLPLALFITVNNEINQAIRISHKDRSNREIQKAEEKLYTFFKESKKPLSYHALKQDNRITKKVKQKDKTQIMAVIETQPWRHEVSGHPGLMQLEQDRGATAWSMLSSPIEAHHKMLDFFLDSFSVLIIKTPLTDTTITLYNRDMRKKDTPFEQRASYNIVSGTKIVEGQPAKEAKENFIIGSSMSLVQGVPTIGERLKRGSSLSISTQNKQGGIKDKHIKFIVYNDDYVPSLTRQNIDKLLKNKIDIILLPVGSPTLNAYTDYIKENKVLVLFPFSGALQFRNPELKGMVHFRATYEDEVKALIDYLIERYSTKKFAFFYQDDAYGRGPLTAAHEVLKNHGINKWLDLAYLRGSTDFQSQARKLKEYQPDAIGFFSSAQPTREFMRQVGTEYLAHVQLFGISFLGEDSLRYYIKSQGLNITFGAVVPNPYLSNLEIVKEYRKYMTEHKYPLDVISLEGYITASLFLQLLQEIEGPLTKDNVLKKIESLKDYEFKGLKLTYNPETRSLAQYIWIETDPKLEWIRKPISYKAKKKSAPHISQPMRVPTPPAQKQGNIIIKNKEQ